LSAELTKTHSFRLLFWRFCQLVYWIVCIFCGRSNHFTKFNAFKRVLF